MINNLVSTIHGLGLVQGAASITTPFEGIKGALQTIATQVSNIAPWVALLCMVVIGVMWMSGQRMSQIAKSWLGRVVIGIGIVAMAVFIVPWLYSIFGSSASVSLTK